MKKELVNSYKIWNDSFYTIEANIDTDLWCQDLVNSFEKKMNFSHQYDVVSMIGSMTYCKKPKVLFSLVNKYLKKRGIFIFTHRIDLWQKQNFDKLIEEFNKYFSLEYRSGPLNYLPKNRDFSDQVKIRIIVLKKI